MLERRRNWRKRMNSKNFIHQIIDDEDLCHQISTSGEASNYNTKQRKSSNSVEAPRPKFIIKVKAVKKPNETTSGNTQESKVDLTNMGLHSLCQNYGSNEESHPQLW